LKIELIVWGALVGLTLYVLIAHFVG